MNKEILSQNPELLAIFLSADSENFSIFAKTQTFQNAHNWQNFQNLKTFLDENLTQILKNTDFKKLFDSLEFLKNQNIISSKKFDEILQKTQHAQLSESKKSNEQKSSANASQMHQIFNENFEKILKLCELESDKNQAQKIKHNFENQKFSIGVSGVLSAGKSTFLNALLGADILGTSTIPETANLTILKHGKSGAKVHFWNKTQWEEMCADSENDAALKSFIEQTREIFGTKLDELIKPNTLAQDIELSELNAYTSANDKSKMCNLIQKVELFTPLKFLENNVEIVDTPGLDDPITKREEITKSYILDCDLLIHLMNASCAATAVDVDFILETLLERNISRLLIVLTRADLISPKELEQSLSYTKSSLQAQILKFSRDIDPAKILERITFIPISGYHALLNKLGKPTHLSIEKTGILEVENYLDSVLFGENSLKNLDIAHIALKNLLKLCANIKEQLELKSKLLNSSKQELQDFIAQQNELFNNLEAQKNATQNNLITQENELASTINSLNAFLTMSLKTAQDRLFERVTQKIQYAKSKKLDIQKDDFNELFHIALKDIFTDITRDYKYKLNTKITQIVELVFKKLDLQITHNLPSFNFHAKDEQIAHFALSLSANTFKNMKNFENISSIFNEVFGEFSEIIFKKSAHTKDEFLVFFENLKAQIDKYFSDEIAQKKEILDNALQTAQNSNDENLKAQIAQNINQTTQIQLALKAAL